MRWTWVMPASWFPWAVTRPFSCVATPSTICPPPCCSSCLPTWPLMSMVSRSAWFSVLSPILCFLSAAAALLYCVLWVGCQGEECSIISCFPIYLSVLFDYICAKYLWCDQRHMPPVFVVKWWVGIVRIPLFPSFCSSFLLIHST